MGFVSVDTERCSGCGLCARICPYNAFSIVHGKAVYGIEECFLCGHCYAVCPENAIRADGFIAAGCSFSETGYVAPGSADSDVLAGIMRSRRSCRSYSPKEVPEAMLLNLVELGIAAPSGTNSQSWRFRIFSGRAQVEHLGEVVGNYFRRLNRLAQNGFLRGFLQLLGQGGLAAYHQRYYDSVQEALRQWDEEHVDRLFHGAPAVICISGDAVASCPAEDALLAAQNILLAAHAMGLGTCLIGFAVEAARRSRQVRAAVKLPEGEELYAVIAVGYPAVVYQRLTPRRVIVPEIFNS